MREGVCVRKRRVIFDKKFDKKEAVAIDQLRSALGQVGPDCLGGDEIENLQDP